MNLQSTEIEKIVWLAFSFVCTVVILD